MFRRDYASTYFVDKTDILVELVPLVELKGNEIEESGMIASYFGKGVFSVTTGPVRDHMMVRWRCCGRD